MLNLKGSQSGFGLIEVLVSILVLSIGVLGVTGLQLIALDANRDALFRSGAIQVANDIIDRIDVNSDVVYGPVDFADAPPTATDCRTSDCSPDQMADFDTASWLCAINSEASDGSTYPICETLGIDGLLPIGEAAISRTGDEYQIQVRWTDVKATQFSSVTFFFQVK